MCNSPISIVVPAHNEQSVIGRLLAALSDRTDRDEVIVVCDGCTDATAEIARQYPGVVVIEQERLGKPQALNAGDRVATAFPRFYVDADIVVNAAALREVAANMTGGTLAGAPRLQVNLEGASWAVRRFYDIWARLPYAADAVLGSGVIGLTSAGRARFGAFPDVIGDDEFVRRLFALSERVRTTRGTFLVTAPKRLSGLIRIKTRSRLGILQLDRQYGPAPPEAGAPGSSALAAFLRDPRRWISLIVFTLVRLIVLTRARRRLKKNEVAFWDRDESSRTFPTGGSQERPPSRIEFVDGIRAAAAVYVVLHHVWLTTYPDYVHDPGPAPLRWLGYGYVAVCVFIVVSGFSLSAAPARHDWHLQGSYSTFVRRRAWRILPTYWAALALSCVVFGVVTPDLTGDRITAKGILVHGLLLQDVIDSAKPNGVFWSIAVEWQIYFLFPLFVWAMRSVGPTRLVGLASVGIIVLYGLATSVDPLGRLLNLSPQFVALFVMGMGAGHLVNKDVPARTGRRLLIAGSVLALLFIGLCVLLDLRVVEQQYFWIAFVAGGATACLVASLLLGQARWLNKLLASDVMRSTGMYSYSIYCVHLPILWLTWHFLVAKLATGTTERFAALMALGVPLALLGSYVFSRVFEKPFLSHRSFRSLRELTPWRVRPSEGQQGETSPVRAATSSAARP